VCGHDLGQLLAILADLMDPRFAEEVCVWHDYIAVCVVHRDGRITWLRPEHRPTDTQAAAA
jgi:hypothetical protein